jgi:GTP-binding protein
VGLLGLPNAGKSSLIRRLSSARPKVADYPFTTLIPNLGVVSPRPEHSFVIADVPGLIAGAADGAGLGIRFLKHLARTRLLLHLIDLAPVAGSPGPLVQLQTIERELAAYDPALAERERWLVLNKIDLLDADGALAARRALLEQSGWTGPVFSISAVTGRGTEALALAALERLEALPHPWRRPETEAAAVADEPWHPLG